MPDGRVHTVGGVDVLMIDSANVIDSIGQQAHARLEGVDNQVIIERTITYLRTLDTPPIILTHDKALAQPLLSSGLVAGVIAGRSYTPSVRKVGDTVELIAGTAGGHGPEDGLSVGTIIANKAYVTAATVDEQNRITSAYIITFYPKTPRVDIGPITRFTYSDSVNGAPTIPAATNDPAFIPRQLGQEGAIEESDPTPSLR
jgi:hypothetical protein